MKARSVRFAALLLSVLMLLVAPLMVVHAAASAQVVPPPPAGITPEMWAALVSALMGFVGFWITQGVKSLSAMLAKFPLLSWIDISGWGSVITAFIVTGLVFYVAYGLSFVPPAYLAAVPLFLQLVIGWLTSFGTHSTVKTLAGPKYALPLNAKGAQPK